MAQVRNLFKRISSKLIFSRLFAVAVDRARNWKYFYKVSLLRRCVRDRSNEMLSKLLRYFEWTSSLGIFLFNMISWRKKKAADDVLQCREERSRARDIENMGWELIHGEKDETLWFMSLRVCRSEPMGFMETRKKVSCTARKFMHIKSLYSSLCKVRFWHFRAIFKRPKINFLVYSHFKLFA